MMVSPVPVPALRSEPVIAIEPDWNVSVPVPALFAIVRLLVPVMPPL